METNKLEYKCPFCGQEYNPQNVLCSNCNRAPSSDNYTLLKRSIIQMAQNLDEWQKLKGPEKSSDEHELILEHLPGVLRSLVQEVERSQVPLSMENAMHRVLQNSLVKFGG